MRSESYLLAYGLQGSYLRVAYGCEMRKLQVRTLCDGKMYGFCKLVSKFLSQYVRAKLHHQMPRVRERARS